MSQTKEEREALLSFKKFLSLYEDHPSKSKYKEIVFRIGIEIIDCMDSSTVSRFKKIINTRHDIKVFNSAIIKSKKLKKNLEEELADRKNLTDKIQLFYECREWRDGYYSVFIAMNIIDYIEVNDIDSMRAEVFLRKFIIDPSISDEIDWNIAYYRGEACCRIENILNGV